MLKEAKEDVGSPGDELQHCVALMWVLGAKLKSSAELVHPFSH